MRINTYEEIQLDRRLDSQIEKEKKDPPKPPYPGCSGLGKWCETCAQRFAARRVFHGWDKAQGRVDHISMVWFKGPIQANEYAVKSQKVGMLVRGPLHVTPDEHSNSLFRVDVKFP